MGGETSAILLIEVPLDLLLTAWSCKHHEPVCDGLEQLPLAVVEVVAGQHAEKVVSPSPGHAAPQLQPVRPEPHERHASIGWVLARLDQASVPEPAEQPAHRGEPRTE